MSYFAFVDALIEANLIVCLMFCFLHMLGVSVIDMI